MKGSIVNREQLLDLVAQDRRKGLTIAFANGCFDLLHVGHIRYLQAAAAEADRLIVAVNDDLTAGAKGPGRPILPAHDRAELVREPAQQLLELGRSPRPWIERS